MLRIFITIALTLLIVAVVIGITYLIDKWIVSSVQKKVKRQIEDDPLKDFELRELIYSVELKKIMEENPKRILYFYNDIQ